jgi:hypothetical protein
MPPSPSDAGYSATHTASASKKTAAGTGTRTPARTPAAYAHQCTRMQSQTRGRMRASEPSRKHRASARLLTTPAIVFIPRPQPPPLATPHTTQVWPRHHPRPRPHDAALWIRDPHTTRPACPYHTIGTVSPIARTPFRRSPERRVGGLMAEPLTSKFLPFPIRGNRKVH